MMSKQCIFNLEKERKTIAVAYHRGFKIHTAATAVEELRTSMAKLPRNGKAPATPWSRTPLEQDPLQVGLNNSLSPSKLIPQV
jgi:hypothetical protein